LRKAEEIPGLKENQGEGFQKVIKQDGESSQLSE
jgi:hypothetical protein